MKPALRLVGTVRRTCRWRTRWSLPAAVAPRFRRKAWVAMDFQNTAILLVSGRNPRCVQSPDFSEIVMNPIITDQPFRQNAKCFFSKTHTPHAYTLSHADTFPVIIVLELELYPSFWRVSWSGADGQCSVAQRALNPSSSREP
jgi:hypothetical protein